MRVLYLFFYYNVSHIVLIFFIFCRSFPRWSVRYNTREIEICGYGAISHDDQKWKDDGDQGKCSSLSSKRKYLKHL